jgi:hypothetical protein
MKKIFGRRLRTTKSERDAIADVVMHAMDARKEKERKKQRKRTKGIQRLHRVAVAVSRSPPSTSDVMARWFCCCTPTNAVAPVDPTNTLDDSVASSTSSSSDSDDYDSSE